MPTSTILEAPTMGSASIDVFAADLQPEGQTIWSGTEDLFALLTSQPDQWNVNPRLPFLSMPFLNQGYVEEQQQMSSTGSSSRAREAMQHLSDVVQDLSVTLSRDVASSGVTSEFLDLCLSTYFSQFELVFPLLHKPTFRIKECTAPLLLNMLALGSLFVVSDGARARGEALWRLAHTAVATSWHSMLEQTPGGDHGKGVQLVLTALLGQAYAVLSSNRSIRLTSHVFHGLGFYWARQAGIALESTLPFVNWPSDQSTAEEVSATWKSWAAREVRKRALLGHYILDGLIAQSSGFSNSARHTANNMRLPCSDEAFAAASASEWLAVCGPRVRHRAPSIRELLNQLFEPSTQFTREMLPHMTIPALLEALQSLIPEVHEAGGTTIGVPDKSSIARALWKVYDCQISQPQRPEWAGTDLSIRWHIVCISLDVEPSALICGLCERWGVDQDLYGTGVLPPDTNVLSAKWSDSASARRAVLHAACVLDQVQRLTLGKVQSLHLPLALLTSAAVLIAFRASKSSKNVIPESICWRTVCHSEQLPSLEGAVLEGKAASTTAFLRTGTVGQGIPTTTRNVSQDVNTVQTVLQMLASTWGVAREMCALVQQLDDVSQRSGLYD